MELLYIWVEDYKNIKQQGFNFSPRFEFHYTPDSNELTCKEKPYNLPEDFFGDNITNVTAIVGENGSGKSALIEAMLSWKFGHAKILIYRSEGKIAVYSTVEYSLDKDHISIKEPLLLQNLIYFNPSFSARKLPIDSLSKTARLDKQYYQDVPTWDVSTDGLMQKAISDTIGRNSQDAIVLYRLAETRRQLWLIIQRAGSTDLISRLLDRIPLQVTISVDGSSPSTIPFIPHEKSDKLKSLWKNWRDNSNSYINSFILTVQQKVFYDHLYQRKVADKFQDDWLGITEPEELLQYILSNDDIIKLEKWLEQFKLSFANHTNFQQDGYDIYLSVNTKHSEDFTSLFQLFSSYEILIKETAIAEFLSLEWEGMSQGEQALINMFARVYGVKDLLEDQPMLLILDEPEAFLHPQWQKQMLNRLLAALPCLFEERYIQIIITSHSPFLISDIPKCHVLFLRRQKNGRCEIAEYDTQKTFATNIHTLLANSFFMGEGLIGEFAKQKITALIKQLEEAIESKDTASINPEHTEALIESIGEPLIRKKLEELYRKAMGKSLHHKSILEQKDQEIQSLKKQIEELKSKKDKP